MKIDRNNYEIFFMDYLDGNLSDREIHMLEDFLLINPDLRTELEGMENIRLAPESLVFNEQDLLKKPDLTLPVNEENLEDFCIAALENDLDEASLAALYNYTSKNPEAEKTRLAYNKLHLLPDTNIIYTEKGRLKKAVFLIPKEIIYPALSIAAALAFMLIIYFRNDSYLKNIPGIEANLPHSFTSSPQPDKPSLAIEPSEEKKENNAVVQQAGLNIPKLADNKKKVSSGKTKEPADKGKEDSKTNESQPSHKLNPSIEIKLPVLSEYEVPDQTIESGKVVYSKEPVSAPQPAEFLSLSEYARRQVLGKVLGEKPAETNRISGWEIADAGLNGLNKITGSKMKLERKTSETGEITEYSFNSKLLSFSTQARK
ncbi:MAG: hypothetical protein H6538_05510 [Bacteroidales bacterium]|nr:hypothetical protein [Bacteroidales bacterium]MCB9000121.1 hypothetical protein [Bacteroidales bacterium]MCB9014125.1 hypothetical protein [Bacteroidales bacterium]